MSPYPLQAARVADQNAKLSIFATRPAIYAPPYNFLTETMGTVALILLALLVELQVSVIGYLNSLWIQSLTAIV